MVNILLDSNYLEINSVMTYISKACPERSTTKTRLEANKMKGLRRISGSDVMRRTCKLDNTVPLLVHSIN